MTKSKTNILWNICLLFPALNITAWNWNQFNFPNIAATLNYKYEVNDDNGGLS